MTTSVLVLQNRPDILNPIPLALLAAGASVFVAEDCADALEIVRTRHHGGFDAVVLDLRLPAREEARFRSELHDLGCDAPVLVVAEVSATADPNGPLDSGALVHRVRALMGRR